MKKITAGFGTMAVALMLAPLTLQAQPDPNNAPKAENPPNWQRNNRGGRANLTPEQRAERRRQARRQQLKNAMNAAGLTDAAVQDAVVDFAEENDRERQKLNENFRALSRSFTRVGRAQQDALPTDDEIAQQLKTLRDSVQAEKERRAKAEAALDEKIHYKQTPRLDAFLTTQGLVGDEASFSERGGGGFLGGGGFGGGQFGGGPFGGGQGNINNNRGRGRNRNGAGAQPGVMPL